MDHINVATTHILWQVAGRPSGAGNVPGTCRICGLYGPGLSFAEWVRPTFTDWDKLQKGEIICQPCQFVFCEASELLTRRVGKDKLQRMRNYSHFVVGGEWIPLSKGDKRRMRDILLADDWQIAIVAESGQKHIIFRAIPKQVQFEEQRFASLRGLEPLLASVEALYGGSFSKTEIESGHYAQHRIIKFGVSGWADLESYVCQQRGSPLFSLAIFLAQKGETDDTRVTNGTAQALCAVAGGGMAGNTAGIQKSLPPHDLDSISRGSGDGSTDDEQPERVRQLTLLQVRHFVS